MKQMEETQDSINDLFPGLSEKEEGETLKKVNEALENIVFCNDIAAKSLYIELVFWGEGLRGASKTNTMTPKAIDLWVERFYQVLETYIKEDKTECR